MLRQKTDTILSAYLVELESFDDLSMGTVITEAFGKAYAGAEVKENTEAAQLAHVFTGRKPYQAAQDAFIDWSKQRLEAWFNLKLNALSAALNVEIKKENAKTMAQSVVRVLREGLEEESEVGPLREDALFLQSLARQGVSLNYKLPWETYEVLLRLP